MYFDTIDGFINRFCRVCTGINQIETVFRSIGDNSFESLRSDKKRSVPLGKLSYSQYLSKPKSDGVFEHHKIQCDIHIVLEGEELFYCYPMSQIYHLAYDVKNDVSIIKEPHKSAICVRLFRGVAIFVSPWDAHMPGISLGLHARGLVKKLVIKIPWTNFYEENLN